MFNAIINCMSNCIYYSTLIPATFGVVLYTGGIKKGKSITYTSVVIYFTVEAIKYCLK